MIKIADSKVTTPLCEIMGRNRSDKGHIIYGLSWHNYTMYYFNLFKDIQDKNLRVFELGLGTNNIDVPSNMGPNARPGGSIYGWREFFKNSKIYGADVDKRILFERENIKTFYCDQTNPDVIKNMWNLPDLQEPLDIIIEDGLHQFHVNVCFFENSVHKIAHNGYFIIEDIKGEDVPLFQNKIKQWEVTYPHLTFNIVEIGYERNGHDNRLIVVKHNGNK